MPSGDLLLSLIRSDNHEVCPQMAKCHYKVVQRHNTFNTICLESIGTDFVVITLIILL